LIPASSDNERAASALTFLRAMAEAQLLDSVELDEFILDEEPTFCTEELLEDNQPPDLAYVHGAVDPQKLKPSIKSLVYAEPASVWWEEQDPAKRDLIAIPYVDVSVLSEAMPFHDGASGELMFDSNALLEFSYEDAQLSPEIHQVRDEEHVLFSILKKSFGCEFGWSVISG
jgi:hypothetical protein